MNTIISLGKIILRSKLFTSFPETTIQSCIVLGNGPSLNTSLQKYPNFFKEHPLLCVNNFSTTKEYEELKPSYYVMLDPIYWIDNPPEIFKKTIENIQAKTTWPLQLFIPYHASGTKSIKMLCKQNNSIKIVYFNYVVFKGFNFIAHQLYKKNWAMPQSQNVLVASLFLAINSGFKNIYLFGADHSWHENLYVNDENILLFKDIHFYDNEQKTIFRPFQKNPETDEKFKVHEIFSAFMKAFYGYWNLNNYAMYRNCTIYNASEISYIDAFKRIKL